MDELVRRRRADRIAGDLLAAGLFDAGYYAAQRGLDFDSDLAAARHYVSTAAENRWSPHPLISFAALPAAIRQEWARGGVPAMLAHFGSVAGRDRPWSPVFDPSRLPGGATVAEFLAGLGEDTVLPVSPALAGVTVTWSQVRTRAVRAARGIHAQAAQARRLEKLKPSGDAPQTGWVDLGKDLVDWEAADRELSSRVAGRVSIVIPAYQDFTMTLAAVGAIVEHTADHDIEVIVVDNGSKPLLSQALVLGVESFPRTEVVRLPINYNFALGSNVGAARSTGEFILFLNNDTAVREGWLQPLLDRLADDTVRGAQPLLVYPDETIQCAGIEFLADGFLPAVPLAGHPVEDARVVAGLPFSAVTAAALLMRAAEVVALRGFDPVFVNGSEDLDLCLRAIERFGGSFAVVPDAVVEHRESRTPGRGLRIPENRRLFLERWRGRLPAPGSPTLAALGLEIAHLRPDDTRYPAAVPVVVRPRPAVPGGELPRLRWSVKNPAPGGPVGARWGDTHFIEDLAQALEDKGQEVVGYRRPAQLSPVTALDDVHLGIRGVLPIAPHPGKINVLWVISHPDEVTRDELLGYDLVYAASHRWAKSASARFGVEVRPLLQAVDARSFRPAEPGSDDGAGGIIFVGRARTWGPRAMVMDALAAGADVRVWGELWDRYIPERHIVADYIANDRLCDLYQRAGVVLCDHHPDMAREGFIANRLFDAVAAGARVVSDPVEGVEEVFGGAVRVSRSVDDLRALLSPEGIRTAFPDPHDLVRISHRVVAEHSFERRAAVLLEDVLAIWAARQAG